MTESYAAIASAADDKETPRVSCGECASADTQRIIGRVAYHASNNAKTAKLDPRYEKMVKHSLGKSPLADPERLIKKMTPYDGAKD